MQMGWSLLFTLQLVNLMPLLNAFFPSCVVTVCNSFSVYNIHITFLANLLRDQLFPLADFVNLDELRLDHYRFRRYGFESTAFLYNSADILVLWAFLIAILPVLLFLRYVFRAFPYLIMMVERYVVTIPFLALVLPYPKLALTAALNMKYFDYGTLLSMISSIISVFIACLVFLYPGFEFFHAVMFYKELKAGE